MKLNRVKERKDINESNLNQAVKMITHVSKGDSSHLVQAVKIVESITEKGF